MKTLSSIKKKAWNTFSKYIRLSSLTEGEYGQCYTCGKKTHYKDLQAGHWIEGRHNAVLLNENYVRVQCRGCNIFLHGNQGVFRDFIRKELGDEQVDFLISYAKKPLKLTIDDYQVLYDKYSRLLKNLK